MLFRSTFQEMLAEMPFDKITVSALVKRAGVSPNTFYYHYQDIYALLNAWFQKQVETFAPAGELIGWKPVTKSILRECKEHSETIYHVFNSLSRDQLERYIFSLTDDAFSRWVLQYAEGQEISEEKLRSIAAFCRYAYIGFVMQFFWNRMENDIDESVDRLGVLFENFLRSAIQDAE